MNPVDDRMSRAQIWLSVLILTATFLATVYYLFMVHRGALTADATRSVEAMLEKMWAASGLVVFFWFQRQRQGGIPEVPTVTQTQTGPDGSKTSITSPAHLPLPAIPNPIQPVNPAKS